MVCPYVCRIACFTEDPDEVLNSGADVPDYRLISALYDDTHAMRKPSCM